MITYLPRTEQFSHQKQVLTDTWDRPGFALWWEQGTGKSKAIIDNAGVLWCERAIGGLFVVAPNGLHRNFITKELPKHLPEELLASARYLFWRGDRAETHWHQEEGRALVAHKGFVVLAMSYDSLTTDIGAKLAREFLDSRRCLYCADESGRIKEPTAIRTKYVLKSATHAPFRRSMTGTPIANAPWDVWTQIRFCEPDFWKPHGLDSIEAIKSQFGVWERTARRVQPGEMKRGRSLDAFYNKNNTPEELRTKFKQSGDVTLKLIPKLKVSDEGKPQYKNLGMLRELLAPVRSRVLKKDVFDLPPKLYTPHEFEMSDVQWKHYNAIRDMGFTITDDGRTCSPHMALTVLLRLQQIACGYIVTDLEGVEEEPKAAPITPNPRLDALLELTEDLDHQAIIWARFRHDIDAIAKALKKQGRTFARYDGALTDDECAENEDAFHRGDAQIFLATQAKGGEGLTLVEAQTVIYYSNTFKLIERLQSEDRAHRWGQVNRVNYIDLIARGTVDEKLIANLLGKMEVAGAVTGDGFVEWLKTGDRLI